MGKGVLKIMNLTLHLTERCNMDCSYCVNDKCDRDMSEEVLYAACDLSFSKGKTAGICFFGGEPLLKKELIFKALDYCQRKSAVTGMPFKTKMTTYSHIVRSKNGLDTRLIFKLLLTIVFVSDKITM